MASQNASHVYTQRSIFHVRSVIKNDAEPHRQLAVVLEHRRSSLGLLELIKKLFSPQASTAESSHTTSPPTTSPTSPGPPNPTTVPVGGYRDASGVPGARVERPRVMTTDIPPCAPEPALLNESPVSQAENGSVETTTLGELIEKLILPCTSISVYVCHLSR
jgi:hypothetical protein